MLKENSVSPASPAASNSILDSSGKLAAELKVSEAEQRFNKHR